MNKERLTKLQEYHKNDPDDPFVLYAIANEYLTEEPSVALDYFGRLLAAHPEYLPTYYLAAQLYGELGDADRAEATYKKGISLATDKNDLKTLAELRNAYQNFLFDIG